MGLDDVLPDEADKKGAKQQKDDEEEDAYKTITGPRGKEKKFSKERWKEIRKVINEEFEDSYLEVMNNYSAKKRLEVVHQAALVSDEQKSLGSTGRETKQRCAVCGNDCSDVSCVIEGQHVCPHHPAQQVSNELNDEPGNEP